jgi:hypothetical protein
MASNQPRSRVGVRILMGIARVLAAAVIAVAASAALADLGLKSVEFSRILPVVLTGEGIVYILMLGGGSVAAPILLLALVLSLALRAGIAVGAGALSPQVSGDLVANAQFYYASYWPAAVAQVLVMALMLRLIRPLIATRRRRRFARPQVSEALQDDRYEEERREVLLEALGEAPDEPPTSQTVLEEQQIGDLAEAVKRDLSDEEVAQALALPFDEEAPEEAAKESEEAGGEEAPLPPGVVDATPEAAATALQAEQDASQTEADRAAEAEAEEEQAPVEEPAVAAAGPAAESAPGEDTAPLAPVQAEAPSEPEERAAPENLQGMVEVISRAAGEGSDVRVWRTPDGRTVLAALPAGTPAAATGGHANALVSAHLEICAWLGEEATCGQISAGPIGAWALQAVDPAGTVLLIMAARGEAAAGRLQIAAERACEAIRGMVEASGAPEPPAQTASALPLSEEQRSAEAVSAAAQAVGGSFAEGWRAWRGPHRRIIAAHAAGSGAEDTARKVARLVTPIERFADALALAAPQWTAVSSGQALLAMCRAEHAGEPVVLAALTGSGAAAGRVRWELAEIGRRIAQD